MSTEPNFDRTARRRTRVSRGRPSDKANHTANGSARRRAKTEMLVDYFSYALPDVRRVSPGSLYLLELLIGTIKQDLLATEAAQSSEPSN